MNKNFFEVTNASFKVGGINKVNNVSFSIEKDTLFTLFMPPTLNVAFVISKKFLFTFIS